MQKSQIKIFIATPMYGGMCTGAYASSVVAFVRLCDRLGIVADIFTLGNESLIQRGRNSLVRMFLNTDYTHMFFIDADIGFNPEEAIKMLQTNKDIVCGAYPRKHLNWRNMRECALNGGSIDDMKKEALDHVLIFENDDRAPPTDEDGCVEVVYAGTGFMLIRREVFQKLKPHVDIYLSDSEVVGEISVNDVVHEFFYVKKEEKTKRFLSEDYAFCALWREHGGKIHIAPWVNLAHIGTHVFSRG